MDSAVIRAWLSALALCIAASQQPAAVSRQTPTTSGQSFTSQSELVVLHVSVADAKSQLVAGLTKDQFAVFEDGQPQPIAFFNTEDAPVTVGLVIDNSGSMWDKREQMIAAGVSFARSSHPDDELFTVHFNERTRMGLPPAMPFTSDIATLEGALNTMQTRGQTALYDAIIKGLTHLEGGTREKKVLIVVSDGDDNASSAKFDDVLRRVQQSDAVIYTIGLLDENHGRGNRRVLTDLARASGGQVYLPEDASHAIRILESIAADIRSGYTIGYTPTNPAHDGTFRSIRVTVDLPSKREKVTVRTRTGYIVAADSEAS